MSEEIIRSNVRKAMIFAIFLFVAALVTGLFFESQIVALSETLLRSVSIPILGIFVAFNDLIVSPVPPDVLLLVLGRSDESAINLFLIVVFFGLSSTLGGTVAWFIARKFGNPMWLGEKFQSYIRKHHDAVNRYGKWAVGLAAITPLPFSVVCWIAGFVKIDFAQFFLMALLRVPRFLAYFYILKSSMEISSWLRALV